MLLLALAAILLSTFSVTIYGIYRYVIDRLRFKMPPGPRPLPFIGNVHLLAAQRNSSKLWQIYNKLSKSYSQIYTFYLGSIRMMCLHDAKLVHEVLAGTDFTGRMEPYLPGFEGFRQGVALASGQPWQKHRKFGMRALRTLGRESWVLKIQEEVEPLLDTFSAFKGQPFNPNQLLTNSIANIICSLVLGKRFETNDKRFLTLSDGINAISSQTIADNAALFLIFPALKYFKTPLQIQIMDQFFELNKAMLQEAVEQHRSDFNPEIIRDFADLYLAQKQEADFIDLDSLAAIVVDLIVAGTDATSLALSWTLLYLCKYPEIQQKCHQVVDETLGETNRSVPTLADRPRLLYLEAVFNEILRHATVVPLALFHSNLDKKTEIAGFEIPPFTYLMYNVAALHHDADYWQDPLTFRPERWLNGNSELLKHSSHFMPFGVGARQCIGESIVRLEYYIYLGALLRRFRFELATPGVCLDAGLDGLAHKPPYYEIKAISRN